MRYTVMILGVLLASCAVHAQDTDPHDPMKDPASDKAFDRRGSDDYPWMDHDQLYAGYKDSGLADDWDANPNGFRVEDELGNRLYDHPDAADDRSTGADGFDPRGFRDR